MLSCALALVLLIDVSASVTASNYQLQAKGIQQAFLEPEIQRVILSQPGGIAVTIIEWASYPQASHKWHHLNNIESIQSFADSVNGESRTTSGATAVERALRAGIAAFDTAPCSPDRQIIDISGDGEDNFAGFPQNARDDAVAKNITINALPIVTEIEPNIAEYYKNFVVTPNGFVVEANGFLDFARAIKRKIITELAEK